MAPDLDDTVVRAPVPPAPASGPDLDDTIVSRLPFETKRSRSAAPALGAPADPDRATSPAALRLPDGSVLEIDGTLYIGRRPTLPRVPGSGIPQLVTLDSPRREVSATHLAVSVLGGAVVVRDMLSTNGTVVKIPGVPARTLLRGESAVVTAGTTLDVGDGNVLEVLR